MKVDFLIAGAQKAGTSALTAYLRKHPEICMARKKELHFFDNEKYFSDGDADYDFYHSCFDPNPAQKVGEATPAYMYWFDAPRRIWEYNRDIKLIVVLRNPVSRAYAHWNMQRDRGIEKRSFWEAIQGERGKCRESLPLQDREFSYVDRGFYAEQLRRLMIYFPREQILVLKNEELRDNPEVALRQVWSFLGVDSAVSIDPVLEHVRPYVSVMTDQEVEYLRDQYEYDIKQLERMLNWDCSKWLKR